MSVTVSEKGWVVIPLTCVASATCCPGAEVSVIDYEGVRYETLPRMARPLVKPPGAKDRKSLTPPRLIEHTSRTSRGSTAARTAFVLDATCSLRSAGGEPGMPPVGAALTAERWRATRRGLQSAMRKMDEVRTSASCPW